MNDREIIQNLQSRGYHVIPNYFPREECHRLTKLIDEQMAKHPEKIQKDFKEGMGGDCRLFGLETVESTIKNISLNTTCLQIFKEYTKNKDLVPGAVLAGVVEPVSGKIINSGGGWHRDPGSQFGKKVKIILYLTDVNSKSGPFTIIPESRISDVGQGIFRKKVPNCHKGLRVTDEFIEELQVKKKETVELTARAGTMILADVSNIHMGKPIENGKRYSLTFYYQYNQKSADGHRRAISKYHISDKL